MAENKQNKMESHVYGKENKQFTLTLIKKKSRLRKNMWMNEN